MGDNFVARSVRPAFQLTRNSSTEDMHFIKKNFDYHVYCRSRYENNEQNILKRICNSLVNGIAKNHKFPKYIILALDEDILSAIDYTGPGLAKMLGEVIEQLAKLISSIIKDGKDILAEKAIKDNYPIIYWVASPMHRFFKNSEQQKKFNLCAESVIKQYKSMHMMKLKEIWNPDD